MKEEVGQEELVSAAVWAVRRERERQAGFKFFPTRFCFSPNLASEMHSFLRLTVKIRHF